MSVYSFAWTDPSWSHDFTIGPVSVSYDFMVSDRRQTFPEIFPIFHFPPLASPLSPARPPSLAPGPFLFTKLARFRSAIGISLY